MLCVLLKVLCRDTVIAERGIAGELIVFLNHLAWSATHLALRT